MKKIFVGILALGTVGSMGLGAINASAAEEKQESVEVQLEVKAKADYILTIPASQTINPKALAHEKWHSLGVYFVTGNVDSSHKVKVDVVADQNFIHENGVDTISYKHNSIIGEGMNNPWWTNDEMQAGKEKKRNSQLEFVPDELKTAKTGKYKTNITYKGSVVGINEK